jgi:PHP family Zn ribbon phosphoesterase
MQYIADLHLHSKYSRAVSQSMMLPVMAQYARQKGLDILSASDFTHPVWFKEISAQLEEAGEGMYRLKGTKETEEPKETKGNKEVYFLLSTEIASIYKQGEKLRRIHNLVFAPNLDIASKINAALVAKGANLNADGRPIIGISSRNLLELILGIDERCLLIPCHVWTPHFGVYGSKSGFDSLEEAFGDLSQYVYGIETGISSDPEMNWRVRELANRSIVSFSDAHSPANMAREATAFELTEPTYSNIRSAIMRPSLMMENRRSKIGVEGRKLNPSSIVNHLLSNRIIYTIEFYPEEGKYHFSGHRNCKTSFSPTEVAEKGTVCPVCRREMTEGVAVRIEQLAGASFAEEYTEKVSESGVKWYTDKIQSHPPYVKLVRLEQIIAAGLGMTPNSIKVKNLYTEMCKVDAEITLLLKTPLDQFGKIVRQLAGEQADKISESLSKVRRGEITVNPGFDGEYGKVEIWKEGENVQVSKEVPKAQLSLEF